MSKNFCTKCEKDVEYSVACYKHVEKLYKGERLVVDNYYVCKCKNCGAPMAVFKYELANDEALAKAYKQLRPKE